MSFEISAFQWNLLIAGVALVVLVLLYNIWSTRRSQPRQAQMQPLVEPAMEPALEPSLEAESPEVDFAHLPQPERKPQLDALIDVIVTVDIDQVVSGDAALAALPATRRVGTKPFTVEGMVEEGSDWEPLSPGRRYRIFQAGVQLANRVGPLNEIEFSEFIVKTQAFADAVGGTLQVVDMLQEVARARELDQFASAHDAQLSFTLCARTAAWSPGYVQQHAARLGFVAGVVPGRMVLPAHVQGLPPVLSLTFDSAAALADDPDLSAIREVMISLDVAQVQREEQAFDKLRQAAQWLAEEMDGVVTDGGGVALTESALDQIQIELNGLYDELDQRELSAGSLQARRLFS